MTLPTAVVGAVGQPSSVRTGTVVSINPLRVDVQGTLFTDLGLIGGMPKVGEVVALIGQSTSVTSSPSSWLVIGSLYSGESSSVSAWTTYTMLWTSNVAPNPNAGTTGFATGRYRFLAHKTIVVEIAVEFGGAGINQGGGRWFFSTPFIASVASRRGAAGGSYMLDSGTANRAGVVSITGAGDSYFVTNTPSGDVGAGVPQVWAAGDQLKFTIIHEIV